MRSALELWYSARVRHKSQISIVGLGRLGSALSASLRRAGYPVQEIRRKSRSARLSGQIVWFCVPDSQIAVAAQEWVDGTDWSNKVALHASGALASDELRGLRKLGASVAAVHPLMTFVARSAPSFEGVPFGMEGDTDAVQRARQIVRDLGGEPFPIKKQLKPAYHAWGAFASPLLIALLITAERVAWKAGVSSAAARKKMLPIVRQTLNNYAKLGPAAAFSGPLIRGDTETVRKHLKVLKGTPEARDVYLFLARSAVKHLPTKRRKELEALLSNR